MSQGNIADIYGEAFDPSAVDTGSAGGGSDPIPAGWYPVLIEDAELRDTKTGTGKYIRLELSVLDSPAGYAGWKLRSNINLLNPNETAQEIGRRELAALGQACGLMALTDTNELIGKTVQARVKIEEGKNGYGPDNRVTAYKAPEGAQQAPDQAPARTSAPAQQTTQARPQAPAKQQQAPQAAATKRPWER